jgi:hypothetical protein
MTKLELTIRQVSDLRDFYLKIQDDVNALETLASIIEKASTQEKEMLIRAATDLGYANWAEGMGIKLENDGK